MLFHILEYMVYIFFRYYIYRYNVYRFWKNECRSRISYWESFSISNSYHYSLPPIPFSFFFHFFFSIFSHSHIFPFPQRLYTFCNCNGLLPIIIKCYSLFQVSDPGAKAMRSIDCLIRYLETVLRSLFSFGIWLYKDKKSSRSFVPFVYV